jgi:hypothetical protein
MEYWFAVKKTSSGSYLAVSPSDARSEVAVVKTSHWHLKFGRRSARSRLVLAASMLLVADNLALAQEARSYRAAGNAIEVLLPSGGCTTSADFEITRKAPITILLRRIRPDECKKNLPRGEWILFSNEQLGVSKLEEGKLTILETK